MLYATDWWNHVNGREILCFASPKIVEAFSQKEYDKSNCNRCAHCSRRRKASTPASLPWTHLRRNLTQSLFASSGQYSTPVSIPPVFTSTLGSLMYTYEPLPYVPPVVRRRLRYARCWNCPTDLRHYKLLT